MNVSCATLAAKLTLKSLALAVAVAPFASDVYPPGLIFEGALGANTGFVFWLGRLAIEVKTQALHGTCAGLARFLHGHTGCLVKGV